MGGFQWGGTVNIVRGSSRATRIFEQSARERSEHGGLWWITPDGSRQAIARITYTENKGPEFWFDNANKVDAEE